MAAAHYHFRPVTNDDLPMLRRWLYAPQSVRWWGEPEHEYALIEEDLDVPAMTQWIVSFDGRPFAFAQAYDVRVWPQPHFAFLPPGALAIDTFIGEPDMLGQGHGAGFLRLLAERLSDEGATAVAIDPGAANSRAIAAYRKAGFRGDTVVLTPDGPIVPMVFSRPF